jgi:hypothetical protein
VQHLVSYSWLARVVSQSNKSGSHIDIPKYRCPGCSTKTCSVNCVQRHKEWAQCSGKRDPTIYVKKKDLATPAGVDHDYNFLSSIERSRGIAERSLEERGLKQGQNSWTPGSKWTRTRIAMTKVHVEKAPIGMSRQKLNKTRVTNVGG